MNKKVTFLLSLFIIGNLHAQFFYYQENSWFESLAADNLGLNTSKYGQTCSYLRGIGIGKDKFIQPGKIDSSEFEKVHDHHYLKSLKKTKNIINVFKNGGMQPSFVLKWAPSSILAPKIDSEYRISVQGTVLAVLRLLDAKGFDWSINCTGGYVHAARRRGTGVNFYNDVAVAIKKVHERKSTHKVLVVNLSKRPATELAELFKDDTRVYFYDLYAPGGYYGDSSLLNRLDCAYEIAPGFAEQAYIDLLATSLQEAVAAIKPDLIIYNASTCTYQYDPFNATSLKLSGSFLVMRDEIVFSCAQKQNIPIAMLLGEGFERNVGRDVIGPSIHNLIKKKIISVA